MWGSLGCDFGGWAGWWFSGLAAMSRVKGTHKGCPYGWIRGAHEGGECGEGCAYGWIFWARAPRGEGTHKGCPYGWIRGAHEGGECGRGGARVRVDFLGARTKGGGHPQGVPLRVDTGCPRGGRSAGEGVHAYGWIFWARAPRGEGTHKGCPYGWIRGAHEGGECGRGRCRVRVDFLGARTKGGGHPQGVPLRVDTGCPRRGRVRARGCTRTGGFFGRAHQGGRAPTRGAPTGGYGVPTKGEVRARGCTRTGGFFGRAHQGGRAPTRGAPTGGYGVPTRGEDAGEGVHAYGWIFWARAPRGEGTHKGCPYGWIRGRAHQGGRAPTRGAPTVGYGVHHEGGGCGRGLSGIFWARAPRGEGTHKGCPYGWIRRGRVRARGCTRTGGFFGRAHQGGRAPTRGAPTGGYGVPTRGRCGRGGVRTGGFFGRAHQGGRAPTRGAPTGGYGVPTRGRVRARVGGRVRVDLFGRAHRIGGRAPTRGAPTGCWQPEEVLSLVDAVGLGVLYGSHLNSDAKIFWAKGAYHGGRVPTRGAPTGCWQPEEVLSLVDAVGLGVL